MWNAVPRFCTCIFYGLWPIEVELGVPLRNPNSQSDYSQSLQKALLHSNELAQHNLNIARSRQASQYSNKSTKDWGPLECGETVWRPNHWKFGKKWTGLYKIVSWEGVNCRVVSTRGKTLIAHHNLLKPCPIPTDKGTPFHLTNETPGITIVRRMKKDLEQVKQWVVGEELLDPPLYNR